MKYLMRGDCNGCLSVWKIPDTPDCASMQLSTQQEGDGGGGGNVSSVTPQHSATLEEIWKRISPPPVGVLNQLDVEENEDENGQLTSTIFLPMQCKLVCGRDDGSIIMVPATQTIMLHLLSGRHQKFTNWPQHQVGR